MAGPQPGQQRPSHILMPGVKVRAAHHHIKGHLGHDGQQQQPLGVGAQVVGVGVALGQLEGKDGERDAPHAGHPFPAGHDGGPHVVQQHAEQGDSLELVGGKKAAVGHGSLL